MTKYFGEQVVGYELEKRKIQALILLAQGEANSLAHISQSTGILSLLPANA